MHKFMMIFFVLIAGKTAFNQIICIGTQTSETDTYRFIIILAE